MFPRSANNDRRPRLRYHPHSRRLYITRYASQVHRPYRARGVSAVNRYTLSAARRGLTRQQQLDEVRDFRQRLPPALNEYVVGYI
mgnify:CR=1 FL=1